MTRYVIADAPEAAERVMALVPEGSFPSLARAQEWLAGLPRPCRYRVYEMRAAGAAWTAREVENV